MMWRKLIAVNTLAWTAVNIGNSLIMSRIPRSFFRRSSKLFKVFSWERQGEVWNQFFRVKKWKNRLPDGSMIIRSGYNKKTIPSYNDATLATFLIEMRRAELTHWMTMFYGMLFLLWNPRWAAVLNILFGVVSNFPFIIAQRYNRPRIEAIETKRNRRMTPFGSEDDSL